MENPALERRISFESDVRSSQYSGRPNSSRKPLPQPTKACPAKIAPQSASASAASQDVPPPREAGARAEAVRAAEHCGCGREHPQRPDRPATGHSGTAAQQCFLLALSARASRGGKEAARGLLQ